MSQYTLNREVTNTFRSKTDHKIWSTLKRTARSGAAVNREVTNTFRSKTDRKIWSSCEPRGHEHFSK
ncbi:unnamed protein product [Boreogadus saida]